MYMHPQTKQVPTNRYHHTIGYSDVHVHVYNDTHEYAQWGCDVIVYLGAPLPHLPTHHCSYAYMYSVCLYTIHHTHIQKPEVKQPHTIM